MASRRTGRSGAAQESLREDANLGRMMRSAEVNAEALLQNLSNISRGVLRLTAVMRDELERMSDAQWQAITPRDKMLFLSRYAGVIQKGVDAARDIAELKSLLLGRAEVRSEVAEEGDTGRDDRDLAAEALAEIRSAGGGHRVAEARRRRRART